MEIEKAIETAIEIEGRIRDLYAEAHDTCSDQAGKSIFAMLRKDEQYHMDYLKRQLKALRKDGRIEATPIKSVLPESARLVDFMDRLEKTMAKDDRGMIQQLLSKALDLEVQTSDYYSEMAESFEDDARVMFARFLEIENAHIQAVQYELDFVQKTGYWFDFKEFDME